MRGEEQEVRDEKDAVGYGGGEGVKDKGVAVCIHV